MCVLTEIIFDITINLIKKTQEHPYISDSYCYAMVFSVSNLYGGGSNSGSGYGSSTFMYMSFLWLMSVTTITCMSPLRPTALVIFIITRSGRTSTFIRMMFLWLRTVITFTEKRICNKVEWLETSEYGYYGCILRMQYMYIISQYKTMYCHCTTKCRYFILELYTILISYYIKRAGHERYKARHATNIFASIIAIKVR